MDIPFSLPCTAAFGNKSDRDTLSWLPPESSEVSFDKDALTVANRTVPYDSITRALVNADNNWLCTNYSLVLDTEDYSCMLMLGNAREALKSIPFEVEFREVEDPIGTAGKMKWQLKVIFVLALFAIIMAVIK